MWGNLPLYYLLITYSKNARTTMVKANTHYNTSKGETKSWMLQVIFQAME
jgi:hypothetical protein